MRNDPFAKLGALDQKLFAKPTPQPATSPVAEPLTPDPHPDSSRDRSLPDASLHLEKHRETDREAGRQVGKEGGRETSISPATPSPIPFDLEAKPHRKLSYLFTDEEFEAMEDLKTELRRAYDISAVKNDIARCAIGFLISDFTHNRDRSFVVRHLRARK
jgi:hypothetical protein